MYAARARRDEFSTWKKSDSTLTISKNPLNIRNPGIGRSRRAGNFSTWKSGDIYKGILSTIEVVAALTSALAKLEGIFANRKRNAPNPGFAVSWRARRFLGREGMSVEKGAAKGEKYFSYKLLSRRNYRTTPETT